MSTSAVCPECGGRESKTIDSRYARKFGFNTIRRRKECKACKRRWSTFEMPGEVIDYFKTIKDHFNASKRIKKMASKIAGIERSVSKFGI